MVGKHSRFSFNQYHFNHKCRRVFLHRAFVALSAVLFCQSNCIRIIYFFGFNFQVVILDWIYQNRWNHFEKTLCYLNFVLTFTFTTKYKICKSVVGELMCVNMRGVWESKQKQAKQWPKNWMKRSLIKCMIITNVLEELFSEWKCYIWNGALNLCQMRMLFCSCSVYKIVWVCETFTSLYIRMDLGD